MSNAAPTVPAKRPVIRAKTKRIPTLNDQVSPRITKQSKGKKTKTDILVVKHNASQNKDGSNDDGLLDYVEEDTWMKRTNKILQNGLDILEEPSKPVIRNRKIKEKSPQAATGETNKPTIKILNVDHYEQIMEEKRQLAEMNLKYEQRIEELEAETARVMAEFSKLYEDNEKLRRKMDTGKDPLLEPYSRVFEDRKILRAAEDGYKKRIEKLEQEINEKQNMCNKLMDENKALREKVRPTSKAEEKANQIKEAKLHVEIRKLKTENQSLLNAIKTLQGSKQITAATPRSLDFSKSISHTLTPETARSRPEKFNKSDDTQSRNSSKSLSGKTETRPLKTYKLEKETVAVLNNKANRVRIEEVPQIFDYMYLLPDSQVYD